MKKNFGLLLLLSLFVTAASAQKLKGNIDFLKGQRNVNITFDFSGVTIDGDPEKAYVRERMADEKTPEAADAWKAEWEGSARESFQAMYIKYCNDELDNLRIGVFPDAQYTLIVKVNDIDPGNFAGPFSNPAKISSTANIVRTGEDAVFATITSKKDFNPYAIPPIEFHRIAAAFGEAGKRVGNLLAKEVE
jgi:hypothetical protein